MKRFAIGCATLMGLTLCAGVHADSGKPKENEPARVTASAQEPKVAMTIFMMSKCPFANEVIKSMASFRKRTEGEVGVTVNYIGNDEGGELSSMHGADELQGDVDHLCARALSADDDQFWKYMSCAGKKYKKLPQTAVGCAKKARLNIAEFKRCREGEQGRRLVKTSFARSREERAMGSPRIQIEGAIYRGERDELSIARHVCREYEKIKGLAYCDKLPAPPVVEMIVINDKRCDKCDASRIVNGMKQQFWGLTEIHMDWSEADAQKIMKKAKQSTVPAVLFSKSVTKDKVAFKKLKRLLTKSGPYFVLKTGATWHPEKEICSNKMDDTANGKVDCDDEDCKQSFECRPETPKTLELFMMSQCPYGNSAALGMTKVFEAFGEDVNLKIRFIADKKGKKITSMHGKAEVDEDKRILCAQAHYPNEYMNYVWCRAGDYKNKNWKKCVTGQMDSKVIHKCAKKEGTALLEANIEMTEAMSIRSSPSWVVNGRHKFVGTTPKSIQAGYCKVNAGLSGCSKPMADERITEAPEGSHLGRK